MGGPTNLTLNSMPWWVGIVAAIVSGLCGYFTTRMTSKSRVQSEKDKVQAKAQSELVTQTVERQRQLDERQDKMMDDFCTDIDRLRDELLLVRKELNAERSHSRALSVEMESIKTENRKCFNSL